MTDAAHTSGLPNAPTGENCLLAVVRWLVALFILHSLIACGRKLAGALFKPSGPDDSFLVAIFGTTDRARIFVRLNGAVRRAVELQSVLLAHRPTDCGFPLEVRRAMAVQIVAICQDLGILPRAAARKCTPVFRPAVGADFKSAPTMRTCMQPIIATTATGPPSTPLPRQRGRPARSAGRGCRPRHAHNTNAGVPLERLQARTRVCVVRAGFKPAPATPRRGPDYPTATAGLTPRAIRSTSTDAARHAIPLAMNASR